MATDRTLNRYPFQLDGSIGVIYCTGFYKHTNFRRDEFHDMPLMKTSTCTWYKICIIASFLSAYQYMRIGYIDLKVRTYIGSPDIIAMSLQPSSCFVTPLKSYVDP